MEARKQVHKQSTSWIKLKPSNLTNTSYLTSKLTSAEAGETSVTNNSHSQGHKILDDEQPTPTDTTTFKPLP